MTEHAVEAYCAKLQSILVALSKGESIGQDEEGDEAEDDEEGGEEHGEDDDDDGDEVDLNSKQRREVRRYPAWMVEVARVAHLGSVPRARVVAALAMHAEAVGLRLPDLLVELWSQLAKLTDLVQVRATSIVVFQR